MRKALLTRLRALEASMRYSTKPRKSLFPDWLVERWAEQGPRPDASGELDLESMKELSRKGTDPSSDPDIGSPGEE
jgi:hypothetical protein